MTARLEEFIRMARLAEAERLTALCNIREASLLRLEALRDALAPSLAGGKASGFVELALVPGDPPRLWIDMTCHVEMAPDPATYRLQRDGLCRRELLLETRQLNDMAQAVMRHVAHHLVEREKLLNVVPGPLAPIPGAGAGTPSLLPAWASGVVFGAGAASALLFILLR